MNYAWMKLYVDLLDDPRMGTMSDSLFRYTILIFLIACKNGGSGGLPGYGTLAWLLRKKVKEIDEVIYCLLENEVIIQRDGRCIVKKLCKKTRLDEFQRKTNKA